MYEKVDINGTFFIKKIVEDSTYFIPMDESNSDFQAYLKRDEPQVEHLTEIIPADEA